MSFEMYKTMAKRIFYGRNYPMYNRGQSQHSRSIEGVVWLLDNCSFALSNGTYTPLSATWLLSLLPSLQVMSPLSPGFHSSSIQILRDGIGRAVYRGEETYLAVALSTSSLLPCRTFRRLLLRPCLAHSTMLFFDLDFRGRSQSQTRSSFQAL